MIPLFVPNLSKHVAAAATRVLQGTQLAQGPIVEKFERKLEDTIGVPTLTVNSGTSALHLAYHVAGIRRGDLVISTPMTCLATNLPLLHLGARILWADVDPVTGNISPDSVLMLLAKHKYKVKAIVCVDYAGVPCELSQLRLLADAYRTVLIEDAAHAWLAEFRGKRLGQWADMTCWSFQAIKHLTTVDGGAVSFAGEALNGRYQDAKLLRWFGLDRTKGGFRCEQETEHVGYKFHCVHAQARVAIGRKSRHIMGLVRDRYTGEVNSLNARGTVTRAPVIGWYKSPIGDREWRFVTHSLARCKRGGGGANLTGEYEGVWVTEDHRILTDSGYKPAGRLIPTDNLVTTWPSLSELQKELLFGTLLGDGSVVQRKSGGHAWFAVNHCARQREWLGIKRSVLINHVPPPIPVTRKLRGKEYAGWSLVSCPGAVWTQWRRRFYPGGIKRIPQDMTVKNLTSRVLAAWYMDDGTLNGNGALFCTDGFLASDIARLQGLLVARGYTYAVMRQHTKDSWRISLRTGDALEMFREIAPYLPPTMRYKLPKAIRDNPALGYRADLWKEREDIDTLRLACPAIVLEGKPRTKADGAVYCLEVANTNNFVVNGIVLHNCNDLNAAIGLANLSAAALSVRKARENATYYTWRLAKEGLDTPVYPEHSNPSWWSFVVKVNDREKFVAGMARAGVQAARIHSRNDVQPIFQAFRRALPGVAEFDQTQVSVPVGWWLTKGDRARVADAMVAELKRDREQA